ncbi:MAG TPA: nicotinate phosphoribosyltransferase [Spirochaetota bacterium]|nr:nicotinate phosphoribosyltransferase [Spirochaetota bacterium]HOM38884.1 nicotinate phosphoribosyltransferase [Spirochaetota bacterium]HPQ49179.1 nicotinate phosphoribosyltransferase [Spirochaetota bacterium]
MIKYYNTSFSLLTDLYQLTMLQGYFFSGVNYNTVFDYFFRRQPFSGGYTIFAGLDTLVNVLSDINFKESDIDYLRSTGLFKDEFLNYLRGFRFTGSIYSFKEGDIIFPSEPVLRVEAPIIEAQLIETLVLNILNYQSLIATKTSRIVLSAKGRGILEFGLRRAQGPDGGISGSRAAYIGGAFSTSNVLAGKLFNIPVSGTMAHSFVMAFKSEKEAFLEYAKIYPNNTILLIDTYDTLNSGVVNAIYVLKKLKNMGIKRFGVRLDSGDLSYLSKRVRKNLDDAGLKECFIVASNELDEYIIDSLLKDGAPIDYFGVGTKLITANDDPWLSGVYKLSEIYKDKPVPVIKVSNNIEKTTIPGKKNVIRFFDSSGYMICDLVFLEKDLDSIISKLNKKEPINAYHPFYNYNFTIDGYSYYSVMLKKVMDNGKRCYQTPSLKEIQDNTLTNLRVIDDVYKRFLNPEIYKVMLDESLYLLRNRLVKKYRR